MITACYERISTNNQTHDSQDKAVTDYCTRNGFENVKVFREVASGAKRRPVLNELLEMVRAGKVCRVITFKLDRLGRSLPDLLATIDILSKFNTDFISIQDGINTSNQSAFGRLQLGLLASIADFERSLIRERVMAGLRAARKNGRVGGRPPVLQSIKDRAIEMLREGRHPKTISQEVGTSVASVYKMKKQLALVS
jgi:DNA invertase Pin-like site-specific DNA recombinase